MEKNLTMSGFLNCSGEAKFALIEDF